jgi:hypothetical protein
MLLRCCRHGAKAWAPLIPLPLNCSSSACRLLRCCRCGNRAMSSSTPMLLLLRSSLCRTRVPHSRSKVYQLALCVEDELCCDAGTITRQAKRGHLLQLFGVKGDGCAITYLWHYYIIASLHFVTERDGRKGPPAENKASYYLHRETEKKARQPEIKHHNMTSLCLV